MLTLTNFRELRPHSDNYCLMASVGVPAGEPVEIESELERVNLNAYLTGGTNGVHFVEVDGNSMEAEIFHGDVLIVNRNLQPQPANKVIARVGAAYTVKIFFPCKNGLRLIALNEKYEPRFVSKKKTAKFSASLRMSFIGSKNFDCVVSEIKICFNYANQKVLQQQSETRLALG